MAYNQVTTAETAAYEFFKQALARKFKYNFDYLYSVVGSNGAFNIPNGSFEVATSGTGSGYDPDNWTWSGYPSGTRAVDTSNMGEGAQCHSATHPGGSGNGAGALSSDYMACSEHQAEQFSWLHYASAAGMKNIVNILWYDEDKVALTGGDVSTELYNSTSNPTSWTRYTRACLPPSGARFMKFQIISGYTDTDVAGTAYWDTVERLPHCRMVEAGDDYIFNYEQIDNYTDAGGYGSWEIHFAIPINVAGELRCKFYFYDSADCGAQIYRVRNGSASAAGTLRLSTGTFSEDISGWLPGDILYLMADAGSGDNYDIGNFSIGIEGSNG